jgi:hypothetical protein
MQTSQKLKITTPANENQADLLPKRYPTQTQLITTELTRFTTELTRLSFTKAHSPFD